MWSIRTALELGVKLACYKIRMINGLYDFYQVIVWINAAGFNAPRLEIRNILIVTLSAVAVSFDNFSCAVQFSCN